MVLLVCLDHGYIAACGRVFVCIACLHQKCSQLTAPRRMQYVEKFDVVTKVKYSCILCDYGNYNDYFDEILKFSESSGYGIGLFGRIVIQI